LHSNKPVDLAHTSEAPRDRPLCLCFIADARSPIARNWIHYFIKRGHEVHVISSYPCPPDTLPVASLHVVPVAFSGLVSGENAERGGHVHAPSHFSKRLRGGRMSPLLYAARHWLGPLDVYRCAGRTRHIIEDIDPDLVHAMRIPFEGILAAQAMQHRSVRGQRLALSVWGNDFTLFASRYALIGRQTRQALQRADAIHCDCRRDLRLARSWGYGSERPSIVLPGAGGVQMGLFHPGSRSSAVQRQWRIPDGAPVIINPRGFRGYVRNDTFFQAIPKVLKERPDAIFICPAMQGNRIAEQWLDQLAIHGNTRLLPSVPREQMADLFRLAQVTVSPSTHDGTPNTLLEAMACGCFPVAGGIESVREWITDGLNGLLCDPTGPESLAKAILRALGDDGLRERTAEYNLMLVAERAEYNKTMTQAEQFYRQVVEYSQS